MTYSGESWGPSVVALLRAARQISKNFGHHEIICSLHLLIGMLTVVRPASLRIPRPTDDAIKSAIAVFAPPWRDVFVLSPGGQTPWCKRILAQAAKMALNRNEVTEVQHLWEALANLQPELMTTVLSLFDGTAGGSHDSRMD